MREIIHNDGTVFGGAVRDWYIHDYHAEKYYSYVEENNVCNNEATERYTDVDFLPQFKDRLVIPNDIDACIHVDNVKPLIQKLMKNHKFDIQKLFDREATNYIPNLTVEENEIRHHRYRILVTPISITNRLYNSFSSILSNEIEPLLREFSTQIKNVLQQDIVLYLDLMVIMVAPTVKQFHPPFGPLDFECNGLIADKSGIHLSKHMVWARDDPMQYDRTYNRVVRDILNKKAVIANVLPTSNEYRIKKIIQKGWEITGFSSISYIKETSYDGHCIICHEVLDKAHYKMKCCDARYHTYCAIQAMTHHANSIIEKGHCIMCKKNIPGIYVRDDAFVLEDIRSITKNIQSELVIE